MNGFCYSLVEHDVVLVESQIIMTITDITTFISIIIIVVAVIIK